MSRRHTDTALLDAAKDCVVDLGLSRTTVSDVARRAGASRMTVYRLFPDAETLWSTLVTREVSEIVGAAAVHAADQPTARQRLVEAAIYAVTRLAGDPLVQRILELEPELLLPYAVERLGQAQRTVVGVVVGMLDEGVSDGSVRDLDRAAAAHLIEMIGRSFVLSSRIITAESDLTTIADEVRSLLNSYLAPLPGAAPR